MASKNKRSEPAPKTTPRAPSKKVSEKKSVPAKNGKKAKSSDKNDKKAKTPTPNLRAEIVVRRDAETVQTKINTRRRGPIAYTPKELELMFLRTKNTPLNIYNPEAIEVPAATKKVVPAPKQIPAQLPKAKPRKVSAVSLDDLFGYNPFAKGSVSAEEKLIPAKWLKYYKKLVALKTSIQREIDEQSQTAFSRKDDDNSGDISASYSQHTADIDNEAFTRDCALSLLATKQQELAEINIAIERMKKGTYGICEITGKPIPAERLRDVPFTRYSLEGKVEAEKQREVAARRRRANATTDIASVTDLENDVPIVFNEDDEKVPHTTQPDSEEESK